MGLCIAVLDKEVFTDVTARAKYKTDLLVGVKFLEQEAYVLIHLEHQAQPQPAFNKRMFGYSMK